MQTKTSHIKRGLERQIKRQVLNLWLFSWEIALIISASLNPTFLHLLLLYSGIKIPVLYQLKRILFRDIGLCLIEEGAIKAFLLKWGKYIAMEVENMGYESKKI